MNATWPFAQLTVGDGLATIGVNSRFSWLARLFTIEPQAMSPHEVALVAPVLPAFPGRFQGVAFRLNDGSHSYFGTGKIDEVLARLEESGFRVSRDPLTKTKIWRMEP